MSDTQDRRPESSSAAGRPTIPPGTPASALAPDKARQGPPGRPVLRVLISALVLVMIGWALVEIYGYAIRPPLNEQVGDPATVNRPNAVGENAPAGGQQESAPSQQGR